MPLTMTDDQLLGHLATLIESDNADVGKALVAEFHAQEERRLRLASEVMLLQADLSTAQTESATLMGVIGQAYRDSAGHNNCWRNLQRMFEQLGLNPPATLPPRDEFEAGCRAFQNELYANPGRFPDFIPLGKTKPKSPEAQALYGDIERVLADAGIASLLVLAKSITEEHVAELAELHTWLSEMTTQPNYTLGNNKLTGSILDKGRAALMRTVKKLKAIREAV